MHPPELSLDQPPRLPGATLLLALTGWMDGGLVSTGTVKRMMENRTVRQVGRIDPESFYIYNFPGSMEVAALFRPGVKYVEGVIEGPLEMPENLFHIDEAARLVFFIGREPHLRWQTFARCLFAAADALGVARILFMGSFGGTVPHTREPRMYGSVSHPHLRATLRDHHVRLSDYEGPAGFSTLLLAEAPAHGIEMLSLVAEIPGYLQGLNPLSIEAVTRRLAKLLNQGVDLGALREASNEWELKVSELVEKDEKLAETVRRLEEEYDNELIGTPEDEEQEEHEKG